MSFQWLKRLFGKKQFDFVETESEPGVVFESSMPIDPAARTGPQGLSETSNDEPSVCFHVAADANAPAGARSSCEPVVTRAIRESTTKP